MINLDILTAIVAHDRVAEQFPGTATPQRPRVRRRVPTRR
jgi:hypothetical protein